MKLNWDEAIENSIYINDKYGWPERVCRSCKTITNNSQTTERQIIGNVIQYITECECGKYFIQEHKL